MSTFSCEVVRLTIEKHPNADAIELAHVGGYVSIVKKGQFQDGDLAVYIPEQSLVPQYLLEQMGFWDPMNGKGGLSGSGGNRVRAIKLRGVLSQGLLLDGVMVADRERLVLGAPSEIVEGLGEVRAIAEFQEGDDAATFLGIKKWEPHVPAQMAGKVAGGDLDATIHYDFENLKKVMDIFEDGEDVEVTEKIHGTLLQVGLIPPSIWEGKSWAEKCPLIAGTDMRGIVTSKGQGGKGLMLDPSDTDNIYVSMCKSLGLWEKLLVLYEKYDESQPIYLLGEIFGNGVQDLGYGQGRSFRAFDIHYGKRNEGFFLDAPDFWEWCENAGVQSVPSLYVGPYSYAKVLELTDGNTVLTADKHIREGVVIKTVTEGRHRRHGRKIAKSVSGDYLTRKGNTTEFN